MKFSLFIVSTLLLINITSCSFFNRKWCSIDNPTDKAMTVELDGTTIQVAARELKRLPDISAGKHQLKMMDGTTKEFEVDSNSIMLNPANVFYVVVAQKYTIGGNDNSLQEETILLNGKKYKGPFEVRTGIAIKHNDINFRTVDPFKEEVKSTNAGGERIMKKIYREQDFESNY